MNVVSLTKDGWTRRGPRRFPDGRTLARPLTASRSASKRLGAEFSAGFTRTRVILFAYGDKTLRGRRTWRTFHHPRSSSRSRSERESEKIERGERGRRAYSIAMRKGAPVPVEVHREHATPLPNYRARAGFLNNANGMSRRASRTVRPRTNSPLHTTEGRLRRYIYIYMYEARSERFGFCWPDGSGHVWNFYGSSDAGIVSLTQCGCRYARRALKRAAGAAAARPFSC